MHTYREEKERIHHLEHTHTLSVSSAHQMDKKNSRARERCECVAPMRGCMCALIAPRVECLRAAEISMAESLFDHRKVMILVTLNHHQPNKQHQAKHLYKSVAFKCPLHVALALISDTLKSCEFAQGVARAMQIDASHAPSKSKLFKSNSVQSVYTLCVKDNTISMG